MSGRLVDFVVRFDVVERLEAIIAELEPGGDGAEVATVIAQGSSRSSFGRWTRNPAICRAG